MIDNGYVAFVAFATINLKQSNVGVPQPSPYGGLGRALRYNLFALRDKKDFRYNP